MDEILESFTVFPYNAGAFMNEEPQHEKKPDVGAWEAVGFVWQLLLFIAVPTTLFALAGRWIDTTYGVTPWATLLGLVLALAIAMTVAFRAAKRMAKKL